MPTLPDVKSRVVFDASALTAASKTSATAHGLMQSHATASTTKTLRFTESLTTLMSHLGGVPPIASEAGRSLESMASSGATGMSLLGGAALAGFGLLAAGIGESIKSYTALADQVENYKRVVGGSAEDAGKMVQTFQALGVGADTATSAMFKLSKAIETSPKKLEDLGVVVAHDAAGNIDLSRTLLSVADAYTHATDQGKKNLIVFDAFGKSGKDMVPVLEQGSAALQQMEASAALTFTDADLQRLKDFQIQQREVKQGFDAIWQSLAQKVIPGLADTLDAMKKTGYIQERLNEANAAGLITAGERMDAENGSVNRASKLTDEYGKEFDAAQRVAHANAVMTQTANDLAAANDLAWSTADKLITQEEAQANAGYALQVAQIAITESQSKVNQAAEAYNAAVAKYGATSDEAILAAGGLSRSYLEQEKAYTDVGKAARKLQEDTDVASGAGKDFAKEITAEIDSLQKQADTLAPGAPLRVYLASYIQQLREGIPADVSTYIHLQTDTHFGEAHFAEGGRPRVGVPSWVGERGPELFVPDVAGTITPHGQTAAAGAAGAAGGGGDMTRTNLLLEQLILTVTAEPGGQTGTEAALFKAMSAAGLNRMRGAAGA